MAICLLRESGEPITSCRGRRCGGSGHSAANVQRISHERVPHERHMNANLMRPPREQVHLREAKQTQVVQAVKLFQLLS
jgi:hypothetical protein